MGAACRRGFGCGGGVGGALGELPQRHRDTEGCVKETHRKAADCEIDKLVYQLYGLSDDEVRVVEGG